MHGMKAQLSSRLLQYICHEIGAGRPLWALLWANRYLASHDPLRLSLVKRAKPLLTEHSGYRALPASLIVNVLDGKSLTDLPSNEMAMLLAHPEQRNSPERKTVPLGIKRKYCRDATSRRQFPARYATPTLSRTRW